MKEVLEKFYAAFKQLDAEGMAACYHEDVTFSDPAFGTLKGVHAGNMWRMLCESQKEGTNEFKVVYSGIEANAETGKAHWEAYYVFSKTGRNVHNIIDAEFKFKDGKIIEHHDDFNMHKWAGQALGFSGKLLGWTGFFKKKLQAQTNSLLAKYEAKN